MDREIKSSNKRGGGVQVLKGDGAAQLLDKIRSYFARANISNQSKLLHGTVIFLKEAILLEVL